MLVSCILTSCNRPRFIRQALKSIQDQTWLDYELVVMDDSDPELLDVRKAVSEFRFPEVQVHVAKAAPEERASINRLAIQINAGLERVTGDLVCYLPDDDFLFPDWFEQGARFFAGRNEVLQAYGALHYTSSPDMDFTQTNGVRFPGRPVACALGVLDHSQVMHRRRRPPLLWPTGPETLKEPDGFFFRELAKSGPFYPIMTACASVKRLHEKCLQRSASLGGLRE